MYERESSRPAGATQLMGINDRDRWGGLGVMIGEPARRGRGYSTETTRLMLDHALIAIDSHNITRTCTELSLGGIRACEKAGFQELGCREQRWRAGDRLHDEVHVQRLSSGFESTALSTGHLPEQPGAE